MELVSECGLSFTLTSFKNKLGPLSHKYVRDICFPDLIGKGCDGICRMYITKKGELRLSFFNVDGWVYGKITPTHLV